MNQVVHTTTFKPNASFSERESSINNDLLRIMDVLRQRGFYPLGHQITNKNNTSATIVVSYRL
jgi:hypothetical protein